MIKIFSIDFEFRKHTCFAIIRISRKTGATEYHVRVMNSRLDNILCGYNTFREISGKLVNDFPGDTKEQQNLRSVIYHKLEEYIKRRDTEGEFPPIFAS